MPADPDPRGTAVGAVVTALTAALALALTTWVALDTSRGQRWDDWAMSTVVAGRDARLAVLSVLGYVSIGAIALVAAACVIVALLRGRSRLAFAAVAVIAGANLTTQALKHVLLDRSDLGLGTLNSLPSGHTTVVASAVGAALLVVPAALRPLVALGGGLVTTLTGASTIVAGWHRPADIVAALAVCLLWTAGAAACVRGPAHTGAGSAVAALIGSAGALVLLVAVGVRPLLGWDGFVEASLVLGAITLVTALYVAAAAAVAPAE
jgi:hypothetical protein